jgi:deazaflavin-dependent oxidoreductase (nitroreductase family)
MDTSATMDSRTRKTRVPSFVPFFNPLARRLLGAGVPLGPNAVLTVRGRKSGALRSTPVALVEVGGRQWIVGTFGEVNWVQNLRADGDATITVKRRALPVQAIELSPAEVSTFFREVLNPYINRVPLGRWMIGTLLGARDILNDPEGAAATHPVFELKPRS